MSCRSAYGYYGYATQAIGNLGSGVTALASMYGWFCALESDAVYCWSATSNATTATQVVASNATAIVMGVWPNNPTLAVVMIAMAGSAQLAGTAPFAGTCDSASISMLDMLNAV